MNDTFLITALYDKKTNKTTIVILKKKLPYQTFSFMGLKIIKLTTLGIDASPTSVYSTTTSRTIVDAADNITIIHFASLKEGNRRIKAQIDSLSYNGIVTPVTATLTYKWRTNKQGEYTMFAAYLKTASTTLEAHYRPKKNQTIIMTKPTDLDDADSDDDSEARPIKTKLSGMIIPSIVTSQAKLNITY